MKNITIIYGSPRVNGNSDKLAKAFKKGAEEKGNNIVEFYLRDLSIHDCIGCEYCYEKFGTCSQKDDMVKVLETLYKTDCIVFAVPIYYQSVPGIVKNFLDRLYVSENKQLPINESILLATYATNNKKMSTMTKKYYRCISRYHKWYNSGIICVAGLDEKNDIDGNKVLEKAYKLGKRI